MELDVRQYPELVDRVRTGELHFSELRRKVNQALEDNDKDTALSRLDVVSKHIQTYQDTFLPVLTRNGTVIDVRSKLIEAIDEVKQKLADGELNEDYNIDPSVTDFLRENNASKKLDNVKSDVRDADGPEVIDLEAIHQDLGEALDKGSRETERIREKLENLNGQIPDDLRLTLSPLYEETRDALSQINLNQVHQELRDYYHDVSQATWTKQNFLQALAHLAASGSVIALMVMFTDFLVSLDPGGEEGIDYVMTLFGLFATVIVNAIILVEFVPRAEFPNDKEAIIELLGSAVQTEFERIS